MTRPLAGAWRIWALFFVVGAGLFLASCDAIPTSGPLVSEVTDESQAVKRYGFTLVDVDKAVVDATMAVPHHTLREIFHDDGPITPKIGPGDILSISVYESGVGELFAPPTAQQLVYGTTNATLPNVTVDGAGRIAVPFVGLIEVSGLTPLGVRALIERRLSGSAVKPQVLVSVVTNVTNVVTLTGAVKTPGRYALTPASETLLQMIALAGGSTGLETDTLVRLTRDHRQAAIRLSDLVKHPQNDIHAAPGDFIDLLIEPRTFLIYGAVTRSGALSLQVDDVTLAQAISRAGGLRDEQADSRGVFLFRYEYPDVVRDIPRDRIMAPPTPSSETKGAMVPVIYKVDLKTASGIFYSTQFELRDKDLIFVPTARTVDWQKYLDLLRMTASPVTGGATSAAEMQRAF